MAKHRSFKLEKFIKGVSSDLLKAYFTRHNVPVTEGFVFSIDNIHDFLDGIDDDGKRSYVEEELHCINDIADRARNYLEHAVRDYSIAVQEDEPSKTTAMRVFLHGEEAFSLAYDYYLFVVYSEKLSHHKFDQNNCNFADDRIALLKSAIEQHFKDTGKSEHCDVRWRSNGDKHIVLVAHGDFMKTHLTFEEGKVEIKSFRPAKEDMLVFDSNNCVLSVNTSGRSDADKKKYIEIFGNAILGMDQIDESTFNNTLVVLDPIKNGSFNYSGNDEVDSVHLTEVRVKCRGSRVIRVAIGCGDVPQALSDLGLSLDNSEYVSAKLRFYIKRSGKKPKSITVEVKPPENTKLPEKAEKGIIEAYLRDNGVLLT
ncbi:MAG: hypothetical protein U9O95_05465 [Candidatus Marinimicrobia bacterium]|nr:hypothetical protein [Candidatus Neomarinimicrobiota bacterium]